MPVYEYTALNNAGKSVKGIIDADSNNAARQKIRALGNFPVKIKETSPAAKNKAVRFNFSLQLSQRVSQQEIQVITRQLSTLIGAGIPLVPSLTSLIEQTPNQTLKKIIAQIKESVNEGNPLSTALSDHPKLFSRIYINMVKAGEASGSLGIVLERLAEFSENQHAMKSKIKAALAYPLFMAVIGTAILFILVIFIVPKITKVFEDKNQILPLPTTILIKVSGFLSVYWWLVLLLAAAIGVSVYTFVRKPTGRMVWDRLKLTLPLFGPLNTRIAAARFGRTLASLLSSGVPLIASLQIVKNILNNAILADVLDHANEELEKGRSLSNILKTSRWFSPMLVQMIGVGEQSGALEKMLSKVADNYEKEVESKIMTMTSMIEPVMILAMGLVVSFIIMSIMLPILEMNQLIR